MSTNNHQSYKRGGFQRVIADVIDLCELQWQLLSVDGQEAKRRATNAAVFLCVGAMIALCALLAAVLGAGWLLAESTIFGVGVSFLIVAAVALLIALVTLWLGARSLSKANESLSETKREFNENVQWIKSVILQPETSPRNQLRHGSFPTEHVPPDESRFRDMGARPR